MAGVSWVHGNFVKGNGILLERVNWETELGPVESRLWWERSKVILLQSICQQCFVLKLVNR